MNLEEDVESTVKKLMCVFDNYDIPTFIGLDALAHLIAYQFVSKPEIALDSYVKHIKEIMIFIKTQETDSLDDQN